MIICEEVRDVGEGLFWGQHIPAKLNYFDNAKEAAFYYQNTKEVCSSIGSTHS